MTARWHADLGLEASARQETWKVRISRCALTQRVRRALVFVVAFSLSLSNYQDSSEEM